MNARTAPEYLEPLTPLALRYAEDSACREIGLFAAWLEWADEVEVLPCPVIGPITTARLVREVLLESRSNSEQLAAAIRELRRRFLAAEHEYVLTLARRAMEV